MARATARSLAFQPMIRREFLAKAIGLEAEADRAGRAVIMVRGALDNQQRRPAGMLHKAVFVEGPGAPETRGMEPTANVRTHRASRTPSVRAGGLGTAQMRWIGTLRKSGRSLPYQRP